MRVFSRDGAVSIGVATVALVAVVVHHETPRSTGPQIVADERSALAATPTPEGVKALKAAAVDVTLPATTRYTSLRRLEAIAPQEAIGVARKLATDSADLVRTNARAVLKRLDPGFLATLPAAVAPETSAGSSAERVALDRSRRAHERLAALESLERSRAVVVAEQLACERNDSADGRLVRMNAFNHLRKSQTPEARAAYERAREVPELAVLSARLEGGK